MTWVFTVAGLSGRELLLGHQDLAGVALGGLLVAGDPPAELAARFNVSVEQVDARLIDLAARLIDA